MGVPSPALPSCPSFVASSAHTASLLDNQELGISVFGTPEGIVQDAAVCVHVVVVVVRVSWGPPGSDMILAKHLWWCRKQASEQLWDGGAGSWWGPGLTSASLAEPYICEAFGRRPWAKSV